MSRIGIGGLAALAATAALVLTACGGGAPAAGTAAAASVTSCDPTGVTLSVAYAPQGDTAVQLAKTQLEQAHPGLTVQLKQSGTSSYDQLTQQIVADIAAGSRPDVAMVGLGQVRFWVDRYQPQPLDTASLKQTYDQRFLQIGAVDGQNFVAPFQVSVPVLYTNSTLTRGAGVTAAPATTSELLAAARQVKAATGSAPVQLPRDGIADWVAQAMIQSGGAAFVNPDGSPGFGTPEGERALSVYETLGTEGLQDPISATDAVTAFTAGRLAYMVTSPASATSISKAVNGSFEWTVTDMPVPDGGTPSLPAGGNGWMVLSEDPCRAAFANELIADMLDPEVITQSSKAFSYIPVDTQAAATLAADPAAATQVGYGWTYTGTPTPWGGWHGDSTPRVNQFLQDMVQRLTSGEPVATVVPETVRRISSAVR
ncbi:extracellular solute-binding protein [Pseudonocardia pini]|uniref:extracellular solute-binding protein n=1 Tax=Pseudonocardia pini TaxID=2758030 RepID=UPI0015F0EDB6|nr:extracellular solute-binding protein [Pseudonocardia pini]